MALLKSSSTMMTRNTNIMKPFRRYHVPRLKPLTTFLQYVTDDQDKTSHVIAKIALVFCLLGLIGVAGQDNAVVLNPRHQQQQQQQLQSEPVDMGQLLQVDTYLIIPATTTTARSAPVLMNEDGDDDDYVDGDDDEEFNEVAQDGESHQKIKVHYDSHVPSEQFHNKVKKKQAQGVPTNVIITIKNSSTNSNANHSIIVPKSFTKTINDTNQNETEVVFIVDGGGHHHRELINPEQSSNELGKSTINATMYKDGSLSSAESPTKNNPITSSSTIKPEIPKEIIITSRAIDLSMSWGNNTSYSVARSRSKSSSGFGLDESDFNYNGASDDYIRHPINKEIAIISAYPSSSKAKSSSPSSTSTSTSSAANLVKKRPRRSVVHLYDMVVCATGCNPLAYKGYGCYCGFLGSGLIVDGIDKCCAKHDWCYNHAKCPPLMTYFVPYYWTCNDGRPKCVSDYRGWKGICGAHLCECDRQFAECLRRYPCPRGRAVCLSSPFRNAVSTNYFIDEPEIHYFYT